MPDEVKIKYPILDHIEVPEQILKSWQITVDLLAKIAKIPSALIMRVHEKEIEVFVSSLSAGNVYHQGEKAPLDFGLYCETVMSIQHELLVPNALKDPLWDKNPDIKLGMISYCGLPLTWPGGKIFGTICILDHQENAYSHEIRGLLEQFRDSVQFSLEAIYNSSVERNQAKEVAKEQYSTLRSAIDSADAHIFSLDRQYRYTNFNKGHAAVMKAIYGAEIEIGRSLFDYQTVPEDREKAKRNIDRALAGEQFVEASYSGEEKLTRLYFEISHNPIIAEDGTVIGVVVFSQDITGRKQTEDEMHRNIVLSEQSRKTMLSILEDQKRSEDLIRKSEEKYRTLLQTAMDGFWMTDGKGKLLQVNDAYCRMSGYTEQELLTMHINDLDSAETAAATAAHIKGIITKGEDRFETKHCKKDGSLFDVEVNVQFKDFEGGRFIVFLQDITQRKLAEEELKKLNQKYEKILTSVGDGIYGTDIDGNILFVNPSAARMLGYETQEMIGKNSHTLFHHTKADGSPYIADECPLHKTIVKGGIHRGEDEIFWTMDGASFDVEHVNTPLIENGKVVGAVVIFKDITQRKRTEEALKKYLEKYQVFFDMLPIGVTVSDKDGNIIESNEESIKLLGLSKEEQERRRINGEEWKIIRPDGSPMPKSEYASVIALKENRLVKNVEMGLVKGGNEITWINVTAAPISLEGSVAIVYGDITERKHMEEALVTSRKMLNDILDNTRIHLWAFNGTQYIYTNKEWFDFTGQDPNFSLTIERWVSAVHPDDQAPSGEIWMKNFETKTEHDNYFRLLRHDGVFRDFYCHAVPIYDNEGEFQYFQGFNFDITERKLAEEQLQASEAIHKAFFENSMDAVILGYPDGTVFAANPAACDLFRTTEEQICFLGRKTLIDQTDPRLWAYIKERAETGKSQTEVTMIRVDGTKFEADIRTSMYSDSTGKEMVCVIIRDLTERKLAEEALQAASSYNRRLIEASIDPLVTIGQDGKITDVNTSTEQITGYKRNDLIGTDFSDYFTEPKKAKAGYKQVFKDGLVHDYPLEIQNRNGNVTPVLYNATVYKDNQGNVVGVFAAAHDITERKQAEVALRRSEAIKNKMVSNIGDVIVILDQNGINQYKSPNITKLFGWQPEELVGKSTWDIVHADDLEAAKKFIGNLSAKPNATGTTEIRYKRMDGNYVWIEITVLNLLSDPDIQGFLGNYHDISDRKQIEFELINAKDKAEESDRLKTAFLCNMSHEIRTPMNGILGFSSLLSEPGLESEEQQEYIKLIHKCGDRMLNIISEIMDISKIESGLTEIRIKEVNITKQLVSVYKLLKPDAEVKAINLFIRDSLPMDDAIIMTDGGIFYVILTNLVKNAIKYTDQGSIEFGFNHIEINGSNFLQFYVKDTGIGIHKDRQEAIFERFIQADIIDVEARQGAGLGLSIAKAYVEMLGGKIWVESEPGKGSCFYFTLPYNVEPEEKNVAVKVVQQESFENHIYPEVLALKILIAEDDEVSKTLFYKNLKPFSKQIIVTTTGLGTIEACRNTKDIDLILMDIRMPNLNGYEATRQIRQFNKDVVIIAQTSFGLSGDREKAIEAGCNDYIAKPINKDELLALIHKYFVR